MGNEIEQGLYVINERTGETELIGECIGVAEIISDKSDIKEPIIFEEPIGELECTLQLKTMSKKRFIKLLMGKGIQKQDAKVIHKLYMKKFKHRTMFGYILLINELKIGE